MNASEKVIADQLKADGYTVIKDGMPDLIAVKDHGDYWEIVFDEIKTNRSTYQLNQKRALSVLSQLEGKICHVTVRRSRVIVKPAHTNPRQSKPNQPTPYQSRPIHINPLQATPDHTKPNQAKPYQAIPAQPIPLQHNPHHTDPSHAKSNQTLSAKKEEQDRPFNLAFLKRAAIDAETLDEFMVALRSYKENKPAHTNPDQSIPIHASPSQPIPDQSTPVRNSPLQTKPCHSSPNHPTPFQTKPFQARRFLGEVK